MTGLVTVTMSDLSERCRRAGMHSSFLWYVCDDDLVVAPDPSVNFPQRQANFTAAWKRPLGLDVMAITVI